MADAKPKRDFSIFSLLPAFFHIALAAVVRTFTSPFRGSSGAPTYKQDVSYAVIRQILSRLSAAQSQGLTATTEAVYLKEAKKINWSPNTVDLGEGAKGHWMGPSDAEYVMLFFHGGGYIGYATPGHLKYQFALQQAARDAGHRFSIFSVSYTLAPHKVFPSQLSQATRALKYLIDARARDPETIFIAGDSAGGNLTAALLLHLARPHPEVEMLDLPGKIRGALLISPWISFDTSYRSYTANATSDYLTATAIDRASSTFIGDAQHDAYSEPIQVEADWWASVAETVVDEVMIWGGGGEILIDGIRAFAGTMAEGFAIADASVQSARTSAAQRRSMAAGQTLSGVDEAALKGAHWTGTNKPEQEPATTTSVPANPTSDVAEEIETEAAVEEEKAKDMDNDAVRPSADTAEMEERHRSGDFIVDIDDAATRRPLGTERVFYLETPRASHEEQIMNHTLRMRGKAPSETVIEDWVRSKL